MTMIFTKPVYVDVIKATVKGEVLYGDSVPDLIIGSTGDDTIYANDLGAKIRDISGNDTIYGGAGDDWITTGRGSDVVYGGSGNDYIATSGKHDIIYGGSGDDWLQGGGGNANWLVGGAGDDFMQAGPGNNNLEAGQGSDTMVGGAGKDQFHWTASDFNHPKDSADLLIGFNASNGDTIHLTGILTQSALNLALASPGVMVPVGVSNLANIVGVTITYGNDPTTYVHPVNNIHYQNNPTELDTHIVFTFHSGATSDIWVWDAQLTSSNFVIA